MEININKDYNIYNITSKRYVDLLINKLEILNFNDSNKFILDLNDCDTDYPETPRLIDFILFKLSSLKGKKEFIILFNGLGNREVFLLHDIVLEGKYFGINQKITSDDELNKCRMIINNKLKLDNIILNIHYTPDNKIYEYGK